MQHTFSTQFTLLIITSSLILVGAGCAKTQPLPSYSAPEQVGSDDVSGLDFGRTKKSAHWESNTPTHGATLPEAPPSVVLDFNFDLGTGSAITITNTKDGQEYGIGETTIDRNLLAMRRDMDISSPDGLYEVKYKACWPDQSCHDGRFAFAIDRTRKESLIDMRGEKEVVIDLKNVAFSPVGIRIDKGTTVTWKNQDDVVHYVNTDSHPAHTHFPTLNSKALKKGESYSFTFNQAGAYPYHCSAHADNMSAIIVVE